MEAERKKVKTDDGNDGTNPQALSCNTDGELKVNLETSDIEIGAVELKNGTTDDRAIIKDGNTAAIADDALVVADPNVLASLTAVATPTTLTGGLYGISACMHFLGTGGVPTDHAILEIRAAGNATGADLCLNAMSFTSTGTNSGSSGYMIYNHDSTGAAESNGSIRILVDEGSGKVARYIRYWDGENN